MHEQQLIFTVSIDGESMTVGLEFEPGLAGAESDDLKNMSDDEKRLQNFAVHVANKVMDALKKEDQS